VRLREAFSDDGQCVDVCVWEREALELVVVAFAIIVAAVGILRRGRVAAVDGHAIVVDIQTLP
jgi:hypothetical protein